VLGIVVSLKLSQSLASWMLEKGFTTSGWAPVLAYVILFVGIVIVVNLIARMLQKAIEGMMLGIFNRIAGGLLYLAVGILIWSTLVWMASKINIISPELVATSKTYIFFVSAAPWFFGILGQMLPFIKDTFTGLQQFFDKIHPNTGANVGTH